MNKRQKEIYGISLEDEKALLKQLEQNYINALADIKVKVKKLQEMPDTQSRAYQLEFQKHLEDEINGYLDILESNNVQSIDDYYRLCYENGFIGNAYTLQSYNVGVIAPINQNDVINATRMTVDGVQLSTKIAGNTALLKKQVVQEIQRGFSVAMPFADIARNISARGQADMNRAMRIARTEGNRIYNKSAVDYAKVARDAGVDIVKQWVAVLDARTRDSHQAVDGEWVEQDAKFSNDLRYPCDPNGSAAEVVNCRCKVAYLPRWYVEKNLPRQRLNNETKEIIECRNYAEYKEKYLKIADERGIIKETRGMAMGYRTPSGHILTATEIDALKLDISALNADEKVFLFNKGHYTGYNDLIDKIKVKGDVLPDFTSGSKHPRDLMSSRAVLAHEYYGHRVYRGTVLEKGSWNDEFRASYMAAKNAPNLSNEDRRYLILDAIERAREQNVTIKYNKFMKGVLFGYDID